MRKVEFVGDAGSIGSHVEDLLSDVGFPLTILDRN